MHNPLTTAESIIGYIKGITGHNLIYRPSTLSLTIFVEADLAGSVDDHCYTSGYLVFLEEFDYME